jgi:uncharacterized protein YggU (UPF0235/DUF167 family)
VSPFHPTETGARCVVRVTPRGRRSGITGVVEGRLIVRIAAAPVDAAANDALVAMLAASFDLPRRAVFIASGARARTKRVQFEGVTPETLEARLAALLR